MRNRQEILTLIFQGVTNRVIIWQEDNGEWNAFYLAANGAVNASLSEGRSREHIIEKSKDLHDRACQAGLPELVPRRRDVSGEHEPATDDNERRTMNREDLITATLAYLAEWANDGHTIIEWRDLVKYGFDPVWLRDQVQDLKSGVGKYQIYDVASGKPIKGMEDIHTLTLLEEICRDLGLSRRCVVRRRNRSGEIIRLAGHGARHMRPDSDQTHSGGDRRRRTPER